MFLTMHSWALAPVCAPGFSLQAGLMVDLFIHCVDFCAYNIWTKRLLTEWANVLLLNQRAAPVSSDGQVYFREPDLTWQLKGAAHTQRNLCVEETHDGLYLPVTNVSILDDLHI